MTQRFAIGSLKDRSEFEKLFRSGLPLDLADVTLMGSYRHWPRNFGFEGLQPGSLDELFFLEGVSCTDSVVRQMLSSRALAAADSLKGALLHWMLPPHVDRLAKELAAGKLLIWIPIAAPEQECAICLTLLRYTRSVVQIHDFDVGHDSMTRKSKEFTPSA